MSRPETIHHVEAVLEGGTQRFAQFLWKIDHFWGKRGCSMQNSRNCDVSGKVLQEKDQRTTQHEIMLGPCVWNDIPKHPNVMKFGNQRNCFLEVFVTSSTLFAWFLFLANCWLAIPAHFLNIYAYVYICKYAYTNTSMYINICVCFIFLRRIPGPPNHWAVTDVLVPCWGGSKWCAMESPRLWDFQSAPPTTHSGSEPSFEITEDRRTHRNRWWQMMGSFFTVEVKIILRNHGSFATQQSWRIWSPEVAVFVAILGGSSVLEVPYDARRVLRMPKLQVGAAAVGYMVHLVDPAVDGWPKYHWLVLEIA